MQFAFFFSVICSAFSLTNSKRSDYFHGMKTGLTSIALTELRDGTAVGLQTFCYAEEQERNRGKCIRDFLSYPHMKPLYFYKLCLINHTEQLLQRQPFTWGQCTDRTDLLPACVFVCICMIDNALIKCAVCKEEASKAKIFGFVSTLEESVCTCAWLLLFLCTCCMCTWNTKSFGSATLSLFCSICRVTLWPPLCLYQLVRSCLQSLRSPNKLLLPKGAVYVKTHISP